MSDGRPFDLVARLLDLERDAYRETGMKIDIAVTLPNELYIHVVGKRDPLGIKIPMSGIHEFHAGMRIVLRPENPSALLPFDLPDGFTVQ